MIAVVLGGVKLSMSQRLGRPNALLVSMIGLNLSLLGALPFWAYLYRAHASIASLTLPEVISYSLTTRFVAASALLPVAARLALMIRDGELSAYLLTPRSVHARLYGEGLGVKLVEAAATAVLIGCIAPFALPHMTVFPSGGRVLAFVAALGLASATSFAIASLIGLAAFWTQDIFALIWCAGVLTNFASGLVLPLAYLPEPVARLMTDSPFAALGDFPALILIGRLTPTQIVGRFAVYVAWVLALAALAGFGWRRGVHKYTAAGA